MFLSNALKVFEMTKKLLVFSVNGLQISVRAFYKHTEQPPEMKDSLLQMIELSQLETPVDKTPL